MIAVFGIYNMCESAPTPRKIKYDWGCLIENRVLRRIYGLKEEATGV